MDKNYNSFGKEAKIQHPLAEIEVGAWNSSGMFIVTDDEELLRKFKEYYPLSQETFNDKIIFDDWNQKPNTLLKTRKSDYKICLVFVVILLILSLQETIFECYFCFLIIHSLSALTGIWLEWLKIKNSHIQITRDTIYIINRFNKTKKYIIDYKM